MKNKKIIIHVVYNFDKKLSLFWVIWPGFYSVSFVHVKNKKTV